MARRSTGSGCAAATSRSCASLEPLSARQRRRVPGLKAERADVILAGAVVIEELMTLGGYDALAVCDEGVRHGLLLEETFRGASSA